MHFSARGPSLDCFCRVKYGAFFTVEGHFWVQEKTIHEFFVTNVFFKTKLNNFLVGSFLIGIGLVIGFRLQSAITQILESFLNTNTL